MPFVKNWVEELIYEWKLLEGYAVLSNVRLMPGKGGGVKEADILCLKLKEGKLEVVHIEVGGLSRGLERNKRGVMEKFSPERQEAVKEFVKEMVENSEIDYKAVFIASYVAKKQKDKLREVLKNKKIEFMTLVEVLEEIKKTMENWKEEQEKKGRRRTKKITLPENLWLLSFLDFIESVCLA